MPNDSFFLICSCGARKVLFKTYLSDTMACGAEGVEQFVQKHLSCGTLKPCEELAHFTGLNEEGTIKHTGRKLDQ